MATSAGGALDTPGLGEDIEAPFKKEAAATLKRDCTN